MEEVRRAHVLAETSVYIMSFDGYYDPYQQESKPSIGRWFVFGLVLVLGPIGIFGIILMAPLEMIPIYIIFYIPLVVFGLYATYRWAQGKSVGEASVSEDEKIFDSMRKHALPAVPTTHPDIFRCENCGNDFSRENALPIDTDVVKCPFCDTRLHLKQQNKSGAEGGI
ncbi:MAG: hypothetical protein ACFFE1_05760 [Candidatus Thorarchaeota archaeon]